MTETLRSKKRRLLPALTAAALALAAARAEAAGTDLVVNTLSPYYDSKHVTGVASDAASGFDYGSLASDGVAKTDLYFPPALLFGRSVTLGEIARMSYWTKKGATHASEPRDWFLSIYTDPYAGDASTPSWYGDRIAAEPYFSIAIDDPADAWNNWTTDGAANRLRFYESTQGAPGANFGSYTDPDWDSFVGGNALSGSPYAGHSVLFFSLQTASASAAGFTGQIDGFTIELDDGSVATVNFEPTCTKNSDCDGDGLFCTWELCDAATGLCSSDARDCSSDLVSSDFEPPAYTPGGVDGQNGWKSLGSAGSGCAVYDHAVSSSLGTDGFASQSLRISNAVTSGCFSDQTFSNEVANEVGEIDAKSAGYSGGSRRTHFETSFDIASAVPGAEQPGLVVSTSADRGDGARMTYLRFEDSASGLQVYFDDYQDAAPYGAVGTEADGCGDGDDFVETLVGSDLDRAVPHHVRETLDVVEGPRNDVVQVWIDDVLVHTGTSWEDYHRWCAATDASVTVDSRLFRTGGAAAPATAGFGFLVDNFSVQSGDVEGDVCSNACNENDDSCLLPSGSGCSDDANPCTVDQCDGDGSCTHAPGNAGALCRASAGVCDTPEFCDGSSASCPADGFESAATPCRGSAGACDSEELCSGGSADCPADTKSSGQCRAAAGGCDVAEVCDGVSDDCPADAIAAAATTCRASAGSCDVAESCDGSSVDCPADEVLAAATACRASAGVCDVAETCDGTNASCPADDFAGASVVCRGAAGECDAVERCSGASASCPVDAFQPADTACGGDANDCTLDVCDGAGSCTHPQAPVCTLLEVTRAKLRAQVGGNSRGALRARATFVTAPPAEVFDLSGPITVGISDAGLLDEERSWQPADCRAKSGGKFKCLDAAKTARALFTPVSGQPASFLLRVKMKRLAIDDPFTAPVTLTLAFGSGPSMRAGAISSCQRVRSGLECR